MRFSVWPSLANPWSDVLAAAQHAEATGWDGVYVADHFMGDAGGPVPVETPTLEATAVLAALAGLTERVRLAPLVLGITYRHPAVLAKWVATTDHLSGGRLLLGVGAGWQENEHEQYGIALGPPGERITRFEEALRILRGLLDEPTTTVEGEHYTVRDAIAEPKPVQPKLPILVGGKGDRMLGAVARHADEWNMWSSPVQLAERRAVLDQRCEKHGRDPGSIATSTQALTFVLPDNGKADDLAARVAPRPAIAGTPERIAEIVGRYAEVGVDELIVPDFTLGTGSRRADALDAIIERVAPQFR
ncbi:MAG: LLM class flavin-dependent oxidoreductase [Actinomycetota bacterium]|nr:LLM class flavin-dependent oxidoreductase [Acidimicrobiia bacterium]MDQ3293501.1 LLM class flavin-dependent oxidoreductase [Actinomycetota bacterium]